MRDLAIRNTHSTVVSIRAGIEATDVNGNLVPLDETLISAEVVRLQTEYNSKQYARDRAAAYPTLTEQADMAYWDRLNGTTTLDDAITAVKVQYPK
tara:strand:+ start:833 stop:1120 length:288 start_codon:yes stop_codon:yes gene_type:complete